MLNIKLHKCCEKIPKYFHYQANEDTCEGYYQCTVCGKTGDYAESVFGGDSMMLNAAECWNEMFEGE